MSDVSVIEQQPAGGGVNKPASGTYGEQKELDDLRQGLQVPGDAPGETQQPVPAPPPGQPGGTPIPNRPGTVSPAILRPTDRPDVPVASPLGSAPAPSGAVNGAQRRLAVLDFLANSEDASEETRQWARHVLELLVGS